MPIGPAIRRLLGPVDEPVSRIYRSLFVNVDAIATDIAHLIPADAHVIDVGGGDGMMLNAVLLRRSDIQATLLDLNSDIGRFIGPKVRDRVTLHPATAVEDYRGPQADVVLICDVIHHVPPAVRKDFLSAARALLRPEGALIVKDLSPLHLRGWLGYLSDRYISGDRNVSLLAPRAMHELAQGRIDGTGGGAANYVARYRY